MQPILTMTVLSVLLWAPLEGQQGVSRVAFSESTHAVRAFSSYGDVSLPVARLQLDVQYPVRKKERGDLVVVYEPQSGHFLWRYEPINQANDSFLNALNAGMLAVYVAPDDLVEFLMSGALYAKAHRERADNLWAAEGASITEIEHGLADFEKRGFHTDSKEIPLFSAIGMAFACPPPGEPGGLNSNCGWGAKRIVSVSREADNWRLVLRNRWDQEVILDRDFNFVSTRRLPEPEK